MADIFSLADAREIVTPPAKVAVLIPANAGQRPTHWFQSGSLIWRGNHLPEAEALRLRELYADAARKAYAARDVREARKAAGLWTELTQALDDAANWARVMGRAGPFDDYRAELAERFAFSREIEGEPEPTPPSAA